MFSQVYNADICCLMPFINFFLLYINFHTFVCAQFRSYSMSFGNFSQYSSFIYCTLGLILFLISLYRTRSSEDLVVMYFKCALLRYTFSWTFGLVVVVFLVPEASIAVPTVLFLSFSHAQLMLSSFLVYKTRNKLGALQSRMLFRCMFLFVIMQSNVEV